MYIKRNHTLLKHKHYFSTELQRKQEDEFYKLVVSLMGQHFLLQKYKINTGNIWILYYKVIVLTKDFQSYTMQNVQNK